MTRLGSFPLRRRLRTHDTDFAEIEIWTDPDPAAAVRAVADGSETVLTGHVAGQG